MSLKASAVNAVRAMRCMAGRRHVQKQLRAGLPHRMIEPLNGLFGGDLSQDDERIVAKVEQMRLNLAGRTVNAQVYLDDYGFHDTNSERLTTISTVGLNWGTFLYLCAKATGAKKILELGTSAGFSGSYLASAPACEKFITVDASPTLTELAKSHLAQVTEKATVITARANEALDQLLPSISGTFDLVYHDALKDGDSVLACVERLQPALSEGALMIFDDIRWSRGLWDAWQATRKLPEVSASIDAGRFGLCFWSKATGGPTHFDFSWYTGWVKIHDGDANAVKFFERNKRSA